MSLGTVIPLAKTKTLLESHILVMLFSKDSCQDGHSANFGREMQIFILFFFPAGQGAASCCTHQIVSLPFSLLKFLSVKKSRTS